MVVAGVVVGAVDGGFGEEAAEAFFLGLADDVFDDGAELGFVVAHVLIVVGFFAEGGNEFGEDLVFAGGGFAEDVEYLFGVEVVVADFAGLGDVGEEVGVDGVGFAFWRVVVTVAEEEDGAGWEFTAQGVGDVGDGEEAQGGGF